MLKQFYVLDGLKVGIERESVLKSIDCTPDSPVYEEFVEEYEAICQEMLVLAKPVGILGVGTLTEETATEEYAAETKVVYAVTSIGDGISRCSTEFFRNGEYVRGMLCDAIADHALFSLEEAMLETLKTVCEEHKVGISKRLEAPHDISMKVQREAWEYLNLQERFGIGISSGFMLDPVKTTCQVFVLTEDKTMFKAGHDCRKCSNTGCKFRSIPETEIKVQMKEEVHTLKLCQEESLMDGLIRNGYDISAVCAGCGRCGKCKVRILEGLAPVTSEDARILSKAELDAGWRLSCMLYPTEDMKISLELLDEAEFEIVSGYSEEMLRRVLPETVLEKQYEIAVDIGTTTIAFQLLDKGTGTVLNTVTAVNNQRKYGADVVSRMQASIAGKKEELRDSIRKDLRQGIGSFVEEYGIKPEQLNRIAIGCNTTMSHLLMGYDCNSLGVYPFTPVNIDFISGSMQEILGMNGSAEVVLLPGISTYVGGDITAGLYACGFDKTEELCLLVDLGTNGEMALGNKNRILVTSTAAGPAFEGGNISCGMGSVAGAICSVKLEGAKVQVETIRGKAPMGICGTGVVEAIAEMLREEWIDETGLLHDEYFDDGFLLGHTEDGREIVMTQKDIRELQLAKAAVRAGVETLLIRYGIGKEQVSKVYLAGGFGYRLDTEKAVAIGMLPAEFADRIETVGNSSLAGTVKYLRETHGEAPLQKLVQSAEEIGLSTDKYFNEAYMNAMMFEVED